MLESCHEPAAPPLMHESMFSGSSPAFLAYCSASHAPAIAPQMAIWLAIFVCWPVPAGPVWWMALPMRSNSGTARSNASRSPPAMMDSVAFFAPTSPPETGASRAERARARAAS